LLYLKEIFDSCFLLFYFISLYSFRIFVFGSAQSFCLVIVLLTIRSSLTSPSEESKKPRVRWLSAQKISPEEFCGLVRRRGRGRLVLNAANDSLVYERVELNFGQLQRLFLLKSSSVSLATVLEKRKLHGNPQLKLLLSYLLAKAVWQFYDSDWMTPNWSKHTI
jgi:hypothetical protein